METIYGQLEPFMDLKNTRYFLFKIEWQLSSIPFYLVKKSVSFSSSMNHCQNRFDSCVCYLWLDGFTVFIIELHPGGGKRVLVGLYQRHLDEIFFFFAWEAV
jgi:hypothetical protein